MLNNPYAANMLQHGQADLQHQMMGGGFDLTAGYNPQLVWFFKNYS